MGVSASDIRDVGCGSWDGMLWSMRGGERYVPGWDPNINTLETVFPVPFLLHWRRSQHGFVILATGILEG